MSDDTCFELALVAEQMRKDLKPEIRGAGLLEGGWLGTWDFEAKRLIATEFLCVGTPGEIHISKAHFRGRRGVIAIHSHPMKHDLGPDVMPMPSPPDTQSAAARFDGTLAWDPNGAEGGVGTMVVNGAITRCILLQEPRRPEATP